VAPDGTLAVSGGHDNALRVWDLASGECSLTLQGHGSSVNAVALTPDGRRAVSGAYDNTVRLWDLERACTIGAFTADAAVLCCAVARDGRTIVAGDWAGQVHFLAIEEPDAVRAPKDPRANGRADEEGTLCGVESATTQEVE
jgi:WD40 repeat protein